MAKAAVIRPVPRKDGKLSLRQAVAYATNSMYTLPDGMKDALMCSVYCRSYARVRRDDATAWALVQRMFLPRAAPTEAQEAAIHALTLAAEIRLNCEGVVEYAAIYKRPKGE